MLSADCHVADQRKTCYESNSNSKLGEHAINYAFKLAGKLNEVEDSKRKLALLEHLTLDWLVAYVCEYILLTFPPKYSYDEGRRKPELLSLQKIVSRQSKIGS